MTISKRKSCSKVSLKEARRIVMASLVRAESAVRMPIKSFDHLVSMTKKIQRRFRLLEMRKNQEFIGHLVT